jgi:glycogen phosphorylase
VGWALGDGKEHGEDPAWDAAEAEQLYDVLEKEVIPRFYDRDDNGLPRKWISMMRESMASLTPQFSANRTVREYTDKYYLSAADRYRAREAAHGALAQHIVHCRNEVAEHWSKIHFGQVHTETIGDIHNFRVQVYLDEVEPDVVLVELCAQPRNGEPPLRHPMNRGDSLIGSVNAFTYSAEVPSSRPVDDYTPRIVPRFNDLLVPLEANQILWQR